MTVDSCLAYAPTPLHFSSAAMVKMPRNGRTRVGAVVQGTTESSVSPERKEPKRAAADNARTRSDGSAVALRSLTNSSRWTEGAAAKVRALAATTYSAAHHADVPRRFETPPHLEGGQSNRRWLLKRPASWQPTTSLRRLTMLPARAARVQHGATVQFDDMHSSPTEELEKTGDREGADEFPIID